MSWAEVKKALNSDLSIPLNELITNAKESLTTTMDGISTSISNAVTTINNNTNTQKNTLNTAITNSTTNVSKNAKIAANNFKVSDYALNQYNKDYSIERSTADNTTTNIITVNGSGILYVLLLYSYVNNTEYWYPVIKVDNSEFINGYDDRFTSGYMGIWSNDFAYKNTTLYSGSSTSPYLVSVINNNGTYHTVATSINWKSYYTCAPISGGIIFNNSFSASIVYTYTGNSHSSGYTKMYLIYTLF
jgi:hypothetical protein